MQYFIMNKDTALAVIDWEGDGEALNANVIDDFGLPKFASKRNITRFLEGRTPPKHRTNIKILLEECGLISTRDIIDFSLGLSLTDCLWIKPSHSNILWRDVNLYENKFDDTISKIAFSGIGMNGMRFKTTSPEFTTDAMLPKCWIRDEDIYLMKGGTSGASNTGMEPYTEALASNIVEVLGYDYVPYEVVKFRGKEVSKCKLMTSQEMSMFPLHYFCNPTSIGDILEFLESNNLLKSFYELVIFDFLILNPDRHASNISVMLDSDTFEVKRLSPIYDNGMALLNYWRREQDHIMSIKQTIDQYRPVLYSDFASYAKEGKKYLKKSHNVSKLINFKFDRSKLPGLEAQRIEDIEDFLQTRVREFLSW